MNTVKNLILVSLSLAIGIFVFSCGPEKKVEAPKQEQITKNLVPPKAEVKGPAFLMEINDLKVVTLVNTASKEIVETSRLTLDFAGSDRTKASQPVQGGGIYVPDEAGKPI